MTNEQLAQLIATLISDFIRPNAQQHLESMSRLDRIESLLERHAEVIAGIDIKLDQIAVINQEVATAQAVSAERMERLEERLEETRQLVAKNASDFAQMAAKNANDFAQMAAKNASDFAQTNERMDRMIEENNTFREIQQTRLDQMIEENNTFRETQQTRLDRMIEENNTLRKTQQTQLDRMIEENNTFRETQQTQLAAIIGNARRIDRLEQQAS